MLIQDGSLSLREMNYSDIDRFQEIRNLSKEFLHNNTRFDLDIVKKWWVETSPKFFVIEYNNTFIGYFRTRDWSSDTVYVGADIHPDYRDQGLGYKSYLLFFELLKKNYILDTLKLEVLENNSRAIHLYKKLGFIEVGKSDKPVLRDGDEIASIIMELKLKNIWNN